MAKKTIKDINIENKRIIVRCDFNVPLTSEGKDRHRYGKEFTVSDDTRIRKTLPTINYLLKKGAKKIILISHLGRPKGKKDLSLSLKPIAINISEMLKIKEKPKLKKINGFDVFEIDSKLLLLENIRFYSEEEKNDLNFAKKLAKLADFFVEDAFGVVHRKHASIVGISKYLPTVSGLLLFSEISALNRVLRKPRYPFIAILGGVKISDKIKVIENLLPKVDKLLIGGGVANTFLKSLEYGVGSSLVEDKELELAKNLLEKFKDKIILPEDVIVADSIDKYAKIENVNIQTNPHTICKEPCAIVDIGQETIDLFSDIIEKAETLIWNGPLGVYEIEKFAKGTKEIGKVFSEVSYGRPFGLVGGGNVVTALERMNVIRGVDYISTGGGAMLEYLSGKKLPGIKVIESKKYEVRNKK